MEGSWLMNIAFFSESPFDGKIPRNFDNMRTEYAWYVALDSIHHPIQKLPELQDNQYDLGIVIIPVSGSATIPFTPIASYIVITKPLRIFLYASLALCNPRLTALPISNCKFLLSDIIVIPSVVTTMDLEHALFYQ